MKTADELTREWFERVWNERDERAIYDLLAESCEIQGLGVGKSGPEGFLIFYRAFCASFSEINVEVTEMIEQGDRVMGHARCRAIHTKTQKPIDMEFSFSARWQDGKMVEAKNVVDNHAMLVQIGAVPVDLIVRALG